MAGKSFEGTVHSTKQEKTIVVSVKRQFKEGRTGKIVTRQKHYAVHCEDANVSTGDTVRFTECRRLSKTKKFRYLKITRKAEKVVN